MPTSSRRSDALLRGDLAAARRSLSGIADWPRLAGRLVTAFDRAQPVPVVMYVDEWQRDVRTLLEAAGLSDDPRWEILLTDASADAPLSPWLGAHGTVEGVGLTLLALLRANVSGAKPLAAPASEEPPSGLYVAEFAIVRNSYLYAAAIAERQAPFRRAVLRTLAALDQPTDLARIASTFNLSNVALASMFGVSRQAISQWLSTGRVPADRAEKVSAVAAIVDILLHNLKPERIPGVARRPAAAYGGLTMLDLIRSGRHQELLEATRVSFDWSVAA